MCWVSLFSFKMYACTVEEECFGIIEGGQHIFNGNTSYKKMVYIALLLLSALLKRKSTFSKKIGGWWKSNLIVKIVLRKKNILENNIGD